MQLHVARDRQLATAGASITAIVMESKRGQHAGPMSIELQVGNATSVFTMSPWTV